MYTEQIQLILRIHDNYFQVIGDLQDRIYLYSYLFFFFCIHVSKCKD
eukprot:UN07720